MGKNSYRLQSAIAKIIQPLIAVAQLSQIIIYWLQLTVCQVDAHQLRFDWERWVNIFHINIWIIVILQPMIKNNFPISCSRLGEPVDEWWQWRSSRYQCAGTHSFPAYSSRLIICTFILFCCSIRRSICVIPITKRPQRKTTLHWSVWPNV